MDEGLKELLGHNDFLGKAAETLRKSDSMNVLFKHLDYGVLETTVAI